jgi:hypothetical protein
MQKEKNYAGLLIGGVFTLGSLLLTLTMVIPIVSVFPGVVIESIAKKLVDTAGCMGARCG